ncbi:MAG: glycosyltransferase family 2 protein [Chlamydiales bacterium]
MIELIIITQRLLVTYFFIINGFYLFLLVGSIFSIFSRFRKIQSERLDVLLSSEGLPSVTIIAPAFNESRNIIFCIQSLINLSYRNKAIIAVNDGSTDDTLDILKNTFRLTRVHYAYEQPIPTKPIVGYYHSLLYPNLVVVDKINGGKADSVNAGINAAQSDFCLVMDADSIIDSKELNRLLRYSFTHPEIDGFGASIRVANGCSVELQGITKIDMPKSFLGGIQAVEYLRSFYFGRMGFEFLGGPLIISGAFGLYRRSILLRVKGFDNNTLGEDMEMCLRYKKSRYLEKENPRTGFIPEPVCWTEVPETWKILGRQRTRWHVGIIQVMWRYRGMFFNPRYRLAGLISYPYFLFGEVLSPIFEAYGYLTIFLTLFFGVNTLRFALIFFTMTIGITLLYTFSSCVIEMWLYRKYQSFKHMWKMIFYSLAEHFGFRQISIYWRLRAFIKILKKPSASFKDMQKTGFTAMQFEGERKEKG